MVDAVELTTRRDPVTCLAVSTALPPKAEVLVPTHVWALEHELYKVA
jgi:hypothetical protein